MALDILPSFFHADLQSQQINPDAVNLTLPCPTDMQMPHDYCQENTYHLACFTKYRRDGPLDLQNDVFKQEQQNALPWILIYV